jgi:cytochrome b subunit of formate dehydrogenase
MMKMSNRFCIKFYDFLQRFEHWVLIVFFILAGFALPFALFYVIIGLTWQLSIIATLSFYASVWLIRTMFVLYDRGSDSSDEE